MSKLDQENVSLLIENGKKLIQVICSSFDHMVATSQADSTWRPFYNEHCDNQGYEHIFFRSTVVAEYWLKLFKFTLILFSIL